MAPYTPLGLLSLLVAATMAAPAPQAAYENDWQRGDWVASNWSHRTLAAPMTHAARSTSSTASTSHSVSTHTAATTIVKSSSSKSSTSQKQSSTTTTSPITKSTTSRAQTLTTSKSTSTSVRTTSTTSTSSFKSSMSSTTTVSTVASTSTAASSSSGKRGMAYNDPSYAALFDAAEEITWGYNWYSAANGLPTSYNFVPMLWGARSDFTDVWDTNVANALAAGTTHLLAFNEPDLDSQSNMTPSAAAQAYMSHIQPYASQARLCSPAITNGGSVNMGFNWLSSFMTACKQCTVDVVTLHWYSDPWSGVIDSFKDHLTTAYQTFGKPVWLTEFGLTNATADEIKTFLEVVLPWMDEQNFIERYAYFMAAENFLVESTGTALSEYGSIFATYTG